LYVICTTVAPLVVFSLCMKTICLFLPIYQRCLVSYFWIFVLKYRHFLFSD
jgi:hypothetical protein